MKKPKKDKALFSPQEPPLQLGRWHVLYPQKIGEVTNWNVMYSPIGEILSFASQADAEKKARELSLVNPQVYRVVGDPSAPSFVVYDYGVRYVEIAKTGERTRMDTAMFEVDDSENTALYHLQARKPNVQNNGRFTKWIDYSARDYVTMEDAQAEAAGLSKAEPTKEFRIVVSGADLSPEVVLYRGGQVLPDVELLANLCHVLSPLDDARALLLLLQEWKGTAQAHSLIQALYKGVSS